jgi:hypothetical protein
MYYVGLDIHDKRIAICVLRETEQVVRRAQLRTIDEMMLILKALPDRFEICYEASCDYGHYHDLLCPIAAGLRSHPEVRLGASRRRGIEWERPHTLSWRSAIADDAEWMSGKSRHRLALVLTEASSWTLGTHTKESLFLLSRL